MLLDKNKLGKIRAELDQMRNSLQDANVLQQQLQEKDEQRKKVLDEERKTNEQAQSQNRYLSDELASGRSLKNTVHKLYNIITRQVLKNWKMFYTTQAMNKWQHRVRLRHLTIKAVLHWANQLLKKCMDRWWQHKLKHKRLKRMTVRALSMWKDQGDGEMVGGSDEDSKARKAAMTWKIYAFRRAMERLSCEIMRTLIAAKPFFFLVPWLPPWLQRILITPIRDERLHERFTVTVPPGDASVRKSLCKDFRTWEFMTPFSTSGKCERCGMDLVSHLLSDGTVSCRHGCRGPTLSFRQILTEDHHTLWVVSLILLVSL